MREYMRNRIYEEANWLLETEGTVRGAAKVFHLSKSTVHKDLTERLLSLDERLAEKVHGVLEVNLAERHLRGGEATRKKYEQAHF